MPSCSAAAAKRSTRCARPASPIRWCRASPQRVGAAAQFEVPLTFRRKALRITFLTAHKANDAETVDWSTLTDKQMTVVVYMGMTAAPSVRDGLLAAGRSPKRRSACSHA